MQGLLRVSRADIGGTPVLRVFTAVLEAEGAYVETLAVERTTAPHTGVAHTVLVEALAKMERRGWRRVPLTTPVVCAKHEVVLAVQSD